MKIAIIGTGYVGLPTGVGFAELGCEVTCIDKDSSKINALKNGQLPLFEDGLQELLLKNLKAGRLHFTTSMQAGVADAKIVMIAVGTPSHPLTQQADLQYVYTAAAELAGCLKNYTLIAVKSTVPVGTAEDVERLIAQKNPQADFDVISLPEFLREGFAVQDFFHPDRIIVGAESQRAKELVTDLYRPFQDKTPILFVKRRSSETIKYASNAFLALKIHYINEMADFCEKTGADIEEVAGGIGLDNRIGVKFLTPGPGYGGSCFPKDTCAMAYMGRVHGSPLSLIETAIAGNRQRQKEMARRILSAVAGKKTPKIAILGLAFKGGTDDVRQSPAIEIIRQILTVPGVKIAVYDPQAMKQGRALLGTKVSYAASPYEAAQEADALAVLTEWDSFKQLDLAQLASVMRGKQLLDLRNIFSPQAATAAGFEYHCVGKKGTVSF